MESSILQKIGIDPAYILIGMLVLIIALFVLLFILMGNIKNRNKQIKRLLSGMADSSAGNSKEKTLLQK